MLKKKTIDFETKIFNLFDKNWAIVTSGDKLVGYNAMTISWGALGTIWNKPVAFIFIRKSRYTHEFMEKSDSVTLSFLDESYRKEMVLFGRTSGKDINKFESTGLHASFEPDYNGYFVAEANTVLKCKKLANFDIPLDILPINIKEEFYKNNDEHTLYIVEVKQYLVNEE